MHLLHDKPIEILLVQTRYCPALGGAEKHVSACQVLGSDWHEVVAKAEIENNALKSEDAFPIMQLTKLLNSE